MMCNSISLMMPLRPSSRRSFGSLPSYMPSSSVMSVSKMAHISKKTCQAFEDRGSLLDVLRRLNVPDDDGTEDLERAQPVCLGAGLPDALQAQPVTPRRFVRKKGPAWLSSMSLLLRYCCCKRGTNPRASAKPRQIV